MKIDYVEILLLAVLPFIVRIVLYSAIFRLRAIHIKLINCLILAGAGYFTGVVPIPLPYLMRFALTIGLSMFLITRYTEAEIFPDVLLIPIGVELASQLSIDHVLLPLLR